MWHLLFGPAPDRKRAMHSSPHVFCASTVLNWRMAEKQPPSQHKPGNSQPYAICGLTPGGGCVPHVYHSCCCSSNTPPYITFFVPFFIQNIAANRGWVVFIARYPWEVWSKCCLSCQSIGCLRYGPFVPVVSIQSEPAFHSAISHQHARCLASS